MRLTVLGSSGGYPTACRACSGFLVESGTTSIWVDAGTGTLSRLLASTDLASLNAIYISHLHADHWTELPIALHQMALTGARTEVGPIPVFAPPGWERATGVSELQFLVGTGIYVSNELEDGGNYQCNALTLSVAAVEHGIETYAVRISDGQASLAYSADCRPSSALAELAMDTDLLLCQATLPGEQESEIVMNPIQAAQLASNTRARQLVLTYLLPEIDAAQSCKLAARHFDGRVAHADPGRTFDLNVDEV